MGESTCLRRSFSNPSSSTAFPQFKEGDPVRALTESISFGRFVSESLHWEKWSTFSSNRYLEEAERFSKPGSVAQKKAFFEAHYRRKFAWHPTSHVEEVVPPMICDSSGNVKEEQEEASTWSDKIAEVDNHSSTIENHGMDSSSIEINCHANVTDESRDGVKLAEPAVGKDDDRLQHHAFLCEDLHVSETEVTRSKSVDSRSEITPDNHGTVDWHHSDSHERKELKLSTKTSTPDKTLNPQLTNAPASTKPKTAYNAAGNVWKSSLKRMEEKWIAPRPRLLHMSINMASAGDDLSNALKTRGSKFPQMSKEMLYYSTSIGNKPKVPVCTAPKLSPDAPSSDVKRTESILSKSTTALMKTKTDKKPHSFYTERTTIAETRARPTTVCAAFGLRTTERAEKRKEFFLKQQQRIMAKEAERHQLGRKRQACFTEPSGNSLCSSGSLVKPQQRSPKSRSDPSKNKGGPEARSRPPWHVSIAAETTNQANSKGSRETTTYSWSSHSRKHVQENGSPNIPV